MGTSGSSVKIAITAAALVASGTLFAPSSQAAPSPVQSAAELSAQLGDTSAGSYLDDAGKLVVTVTDEAGAQSVRAAGAEPGFVKHGAAALGRSLDTLRRTATIPGTAWVIDPVTDQVVVSADDGLAAKDRDRLKSVVAGLGDTARLQEVKGGYRTTIAGGDAIIGGGVRCSLGFNVKKPGTHTAYLLTAGHCGNVASTWATSSGQTIASRVGTSFPGNDYSLFQYTATTDRPGSVDLYNGTLRDIANAGTPVVGQTVGRTGSTSGFHTGKVTGLNTTVNYNDGTTVTGMIATTVCVEGGDSGGSLFANNTALGLTSGGSGNCTSGGQSFYQPVTEALNAYGVAVY
jgi:streptogrisin D